jgi:hypothetical protein
VYDAAPKGVRGAPYDEKEIPDPKHWYRGLDDQIDLVGQKPRDERHLKVTEGLVGTGRGSDSTVYFDPDAYENRGCHKVGPGDASDETLFHELVHALRYMQGQRNPVPTNDKDQKNEEEFLAVVTTNVYISSKAKGRTVPLRANHLPGAPSLSPQRETSVGFLADPENLFLMKRYYSSWYPTFRDLSALSALFNPFREFSKQPTQQLHKKVVDSWEKAVFSSE